MMPNSKNWFRPSNIVVRPTHDSEFGGYWVVAGERRYKAAVELGLESIPALRKELNDHEAKCNRSDPKKYLSRNHSGY